MCENNVKRMQRFQYDGDKTQNLTKNIENADFYTSGCILFLF